MNRIYYYPTLDVLSSEIIQQLTGKDIKVLHQMFILFRMASRNLTIKHVYIQPSEIYLRSKTGYSICGISRSISKLTQLGIIRTTHRRMRWGRWQTNLYHLGEMILAKVPWLRKALKKLSSSPFDQNSKLDELKSLTGFPIQEELLSFKEWCRLSGWKWRNKGR